MDEITTTDDGGESGDGAARLLDKLATIDGRYRLLSPIMRGGMSQVLLAEDLRLGRKVALKLLDRARFPEQDLEAGRRRFRREAEIVASLQHPNIVEVLDVGMVSDVPYMALKLIEGRSLGEIIRAQELPAIDAAVTTLLEIASANEYAHRHGVMHRDIKPDNILLERGGVARLVDFGLAHIVDQYGETSSGRVVGTPAYLAPERLAGDPASPASEVFSAGVVAYEYLTGRYPFSRETIFYSIAYEEAIAPSHVRPEIPRPLEAVLLRMLAKRPAERYEDFSELRRDLERVRDHVRELRPVELEDERFLAWRTSAERASLVLPFVGRELEIEAIESALHEAAAGRGACLAIGGDPGFGKSRLVEEVIKQARLRGMATYLGRALPTGGDVPYQVLSALLHNWAAQNRVESMEDLERVAARVPRLEGAVPVLAGLLAFAPIAAREREQLWEAVRLLFEVMTSERPAVVVLEDIHAADVASLALLRYLGADSAHRRLVLLFSYRPEEGAGREVASWTDDSHVRSIALSRLSEKDIAALLRRILVDEGDVEPALALVLRESGGVALFIAEILRHLRSEGVMVARGAGYRLTCSPELKRLPDGIRAVIRHRLETLAPGEREVADVAAVVGDPFRSEDLLRVLKTDRRAVLRVLGDLERRYLLVVPEGAKYRFSHDLVQQAVYNEVPRALRGEYHRLYAEYRESLGLAEDAPLLARHYRIAGFPLAAARWYRVAGGQAEAGFAHVLAIRHYEQALALDPMADVVRLQLRLGSLGTLVGDYVGAKRAYESCLARDTIDPESVARAYLGLGRIAVREGMGEHAIEQCRAGLARLGLNSGGGAAANLHSCVAHAQELLGQVESALEERHAAVATARAAAEPSALFDALLQLGGALRSRGLLSEAEIALGELDSLEGVSDPDLFAHGLAARGAVCQARGEMATARDWHRKAYALALEKGGPDKRATRAVNLAQVEAILGNFPAMRALVIEASSYARRTTHRRLHFAAVVNYLSLAVETGEFQLARALEAEAATLVPFADRVAVAALELLRACLDQELGHHVRAAARFDQLVDIDSSGFDAVSRLLRVDPRWQTPSEVRARLGEVILVATAPKDRLVADRARCGLARAWVTEGDVDEAELALSEVAESSRESLLLLRAMHLARGVIAQAKREWPVAVGELRAALQIAQEQTARLRAAEIQDSLAQCLAASGDLSGAESMRRDANASRDQVAAELEVEEDRIAFHQLRRRMAGAQEES